MTALGQAAAALAADGYSVFPLAVRGCLDATRDAAWWQRWPHANIGVSTGLEHGLYVIDVDSPTAATA